MNVASIDLCKELYELSGWKRSSIEANQIDKAWRPTPLLSGKDYRLINIGPNTHEDVPAYSLGYLLRKLPRDLTETDDRRLTVSTVYCPEPEWCASYDIQDIGDSGEHNQYASTPEDAACKLAIELFKHGILTKEPSHA